jgi:hypothetical protein
MTEISSGQIVTEEKDEIIAERANPKPVVREHEVTSGRGWSDTTAMDILKKMYEECVQHGSFACVKPKVLAFLSSALKKDKFMLTDDLIIEKTGRVMKDAYEFEKPQQVGCASSMHRSDNTWFNIPLALNHLLLYYVCVSTYNSINDCYHAA